MFEDRLFLLAMLLPVVPTIGALNLPPRKGHRGIGILNGKYHLLKLLTAYRLHTCGTAVIQSDTLIWNALRYANSRFILFICDSQLATRLPSRRASLAT